MSAKKAAAFSSLDADTLTRLEKDNAGMYVKGFAKSSPGSCIVPTEFQSVADKIFNLQVREDDIWVITFPKCGTTWTQEMVWLLINNLDYTSAKKVSLSQRFPFLEVSSLSSLFTQIVVGKSLPLDQSISDVEAMTGRRLIKTHLPKELLPWQLWTVKPKVIYVAREVKDVMVSYYHHNRLMVGYRNTLTEFCKSFMNDEVIYCPFWKHVIDFWNMRNEENVLFYTYEDMQKDLASVVRDTANFITIDVSPEEVTNLCNHLSFKQMKDNPSVNFSEYMERLKIRNISADKQGQFMRKGESGSWREQMPTELAMEVDRWTRNQLKGTDYKPITYVSDTENNKTLGL